MYFSVSSGQQGASHNYFCLYKWTKHPLGGKSFFLITILYVIQTVVVQKALDNWISHWAPFKSLSYWKHLDSEKCNHLNLIILQILIGKQMEIQCNDSICVHLQQWSGQKYTWIWLFLIVIEPSIMWSVKDNIIIKQHSVTVTIILYLVEFDTVASPSLHSPFLKNAEHWMLRILSTIFPVNPSDGAAGKECRPSWTRTVGKRRSYRQWLCRRMCVIHLLLRWFAQHSRLRCATFTETTAVKL